MVRIGTRKSELAIIQSTMVKEHLIRNGIAAELVPILSEGDANLRDPLYQAGSVGLFTEELEEALLTKKVDCVVHSLKDLPTALPQGLKIAAYSKRETPNDVLVSPYSSLEDLPSGALIGTSSLRREAQLLDLRPDLRTTPIRGNVPTRIAAVQSRKVDGVILAAAGISRIGKSWEKVQIVSLPLKQFIPAPGQGVLAVEVREDCPEQLWQVLRKFHSLESEEAVTLERQILSTLQGGCSLPLGAYCKFTGDRYHLQVFLGIWDEARKWKKPFRWEWASSSRIEVIESALRAIREFKR